MQAVKQVVAIAVAGVALMLHASYGVAQQVTGEVGSPRPLPLSTANSCRRPIRSSAA